MVDAFFQGRRSLGALIGAKVPEEWPADPVIMEILRKQLQSSGAFAWNNYIYIYKSDPTAIGDGGFKGPVAGGTVEIGYSVIPSFRRKGLATEAASALLGLGFTDNRLKTVTAETSTANPESAAVLQKIGMSYRGTRLSDEDGDLTCWSISRESHEGSTPFKKTPTTP
jgi:RimJ/RimL family protein N-acetyltransferase